MPFRIGTSGYLNSLPLSCGLEDEPGVELVHACPARLADLLRTGWLDVALTSSTEAFCDSYVVLPAAAISVTGPGSDALLLGDVPLLNMRAVALSDGSRSTNLLCRLVLHWQRPGQTVAFHTRPEDALRSLHEFDACLLIGDQALTYCCKARYRYDLAELWLERMKVPLVLSVWLTRPGADPALGRLVQEAATRGMAQLDRIAEKAAARLRIDYAQARSYLTDTLQFHWSDRHARALAVFGRELASAGLIRRPAKASSASTPVGG